MNTGEPHRDGEKRKAFRCTVPKSREKAVLVVRRRRIGVWLENQSSSGFAVWCQGDPQLQRGVEARLDTAVGKYEVRVAHVTRGGPGPAGASEGAAAGSEPPTPEVIPFRIGLRIVRELERPFEDLPEARGWLGSRRLTFPDFVFRAAVALSVAALVAAAAVAGASWKDGRWAGELLGFGTSAVKQLTPAEVRLQAVGRALGLTHAQGEQLSVVAENVGAALRYLDEQWRDDPPEERARKQRMLAEAARREIMSFLSEEQQDRWQAVLGL